MVFNTDEVQVTDITPINKNTCPTKIHRESKYAIFRKQIDFKVTGNIVIGTTLADKWRFFVTDAWFIADNVSWLGTTSPNIGLTYTGVNGAFIASTILPNTGFATGQYINMPIRSAWVSRLSAPASTNIIVANAIGTDATNYTGTVNVRWFYIQS